MKKEISTLIEEILFKKFNIKKQVEFIPPKKFGDLVTNVAMQLSKELHKDSNLIGRVIVKELEKSKLIKKVELVSPGFINIFLMNNSEKQNIVKKILKLGEKYGDWNQNKKINLEYVSVNPTGFLHVGHVRGAIIGSVLASILKKAGNKVTQEYYINDLGLQINKLGHSVFVRYQQQLGIKKSLPKDSYHGKDIIYVAKLLVKEFGKKYLNVRLTKDIKKIFSKKSKDILLKIIKKDLISLGVNMDLYFSEKSLYDSGQVKEALDKINKYIYKKDGALWLKTTSGGDNKDRVLVKKNGEYTYFISDIAYHYNKFQRGFEELIDIWGADHIGYIDRVTIALDFLNLPKSKFKVLTVQLVKLMKNGKELKMSKRSGNTYTLQELKKEVGKDVTRFYMINRSHNSPFNFDINLALKETSKNPIFAIKYAFARTASLLKKAKENPVVSDYYEKELEIINILEEYPKLILKIANTYMVHLLPQYLIKLSNTFNAFYSNVRIIGTKRESELIALVKATNIILKNGLDLMGISAKEKI